MTQSLIISFCAVFPLFVIISLGCILKKARVIEDAAIPSINKLLFNVLFPCLIFCCTYGAKFKGTNNAELAAFIAGIALFFWIGAIPYAEPILLLSAYRYLQICLGMTLVHILHFQHLRC